MEKCRILPEAAFRRSSLPVDLLVAELGDGIMGSYGVDQVLADPMIQAVPGAMMLAANDPVGAWSHRVAKGSKDGAQRL